ncbi:MAG: tetratricopeptide repeat protein [Flavobacteriia bacterium]
MKKLFLLLILFVVSCSESPEKDILKADKNIEKKLFSKAIQDLNNAIKVDNKNISALMKRGYCKSILGDNNGAVKDYKSVVKIDSKITLAYYNLALNKIELKKYSSALIDINNAISNKGGEFISIDKVENDFASNSWEYDVKIVELRKLRGEIFFELKKFKESYMDYNFCINQGFDLSESYYWSGVNLLNLGHKKEACLDLIKSKELGDIYADEVLNNYCK